MRTLNQSPNQPLSTLPLIALLGFSLALAGCAEDQSAAPGQGGAMGPPEVEVITLASRSIEFAPQYPARVSGSREVQVRARVDGILLRRNYQEGSSVSEGDVLFEIDPEPYRLALASANAQLQQAQASQRTAERDWERGEMLFPKGAISESDYDTLRSSKDLADAAVAQASAARDAARLNLSYATVSAPISGVTSIEAVSEGSLVGPSQGMTLLTSIVRTDPLYAVFSIPESEYVTLRGLRPQSLESAPLNAQLLYGDGSVALTGGSIDFAASTVDGATGTVLARAVFANPNNQVLPGQFVRVGITDLMLDNVITIPQAAVMQSPQGPFVLSVNQQNQVQYTPVTLGMAVGSEWVTSAGLQSGMRVISNGLLRAAPGTAVTPVQAPAQP
ncbi:MAG: efflux RND transporter periplasmic adaptor subunit [Pseudomonadales bacterium]|jgi:membrane fusion protein (multidrug efflux system)|nr:efflux RND transporter periplasmic adaptor subunit [Pseudomonadales bacterium]